MRPIPSEFEKCLRRSRVRFQVLITLSSLGEAYVSQLARASGAQPARVRMALLGQPPAYSEELSLVGLGLAREVTRPTGRVFEITTKGRRKARSIVAAWSRQGRREGNRARLVRAAHVTHHLHAASRAGEASRAPEPATSWSTTTTLLV